MRYMVIERFVQGARPVYERAATTGRLLPPGLHYLDSWVSESLDRCFQLMETDDPRLLDEWMKQWSALLESLVLGGRCERDDLRLLESVVLGGHCEQR